MREIAPVTLQHLLDQGSTLALLDIRENGEYNRAHIPGAAPLPRRLIEHRVKRLIPDHEVEVVVCDDTGVRARLAAKTLEAMGYERVSVLDGGLNRWASENRPTEWGINVPSKDFGEMVEVREHVPTIEARDLNDRVRRGEDIVILDTRTPEEFRRFCIPGGRNVPNGELPYRIGEITQERPNATVIVNCAGRTRSIIGTRALQRMGMTNIAGLKNGTSGWVLAGLTLEEGANRTDLPTPSAQTRAEAEAYARRVMAEDGVTALTADQVSDLILAASSEPIYFVDIRTEEEYEAGHLPGFWWCPGGQAVQRTDELLAIKNAKIVLSCDGFARAGITGSWLRQMGFPNVSIMDGGTEAWVASGRRLESGIAEPSIWGLASARGSAMRKDPEGLSHLMRTPGPPQVIFIGTSREFANGHVPGSRWVPRGWLEPRIEVLVPDWTEPIVVTDEDNVDAYLAANTLSETGYHAVYVLDGGMRAWRRAKLAVETGLSGVMEPPDDVLPAGPERSYADMIEYLRWEEALGSKYAT
jgi:rhodanese-related sulfurtransferase